jgi:hypothetical protein
MGDSLFKRKSTHIRKLTKRKGADILEWFYNLFTACGGIATLGAGFTFAALMSGLEEPGSDSRFDKAQVQMLLGLSWLLFLLSLGYATAASTLFTFYAPLIEASYDKKSRTTHSFLWVVVALQQLLLLAAVSVSALAVMAYVEFVGWLAMGFTGFFALSISLLWLGQSM